jgi:hypothetical protein
MSRPIIGRLIDDNYARQVRIPRTMPDFRTPELLAAGQNVEKRIAEQRAWFADMQRLKASSKVLRFGSAAK